MEPQQIRELLEARGNTILVFGAQTGSFNKASVDIVRSGIRNGPKFFMQAVEDLTIYWDALAAKAPEIEQTLPGRSLLEDLSRILTHGLNEEKRRPYNMLCLTMDYIAQILQHWQYLQMAEECRDESMDPQESWIARHKDSTTATLGFCTGLLPAFVVASSHNMHQLEQHAVIGLRLAMVSSAMTDVDEVLNGNSNQFATICHGNKLEEELGRIMKELSPHVYSAASYDIGSRTVCVSERVTSVFLEQARGAGIKCLQLDLHGRVHNSTDAGGRVISILLQLCEEMPELRLPDASQVAIPTYNNFDPETPLTQGSLHEAAIEGILRSPCHWYETFVSVWACLDDPYVISYGPECVPRSLLYGIKSKVLHLADVKPPSPLPQAPDPVEEMVAVVGMAIKSAGADDVDEFSQMLRSGQSQHAEISPDRMKFNLESDSSRQWFANMMRDVDAFDHRFFKRSPRESAAMDPQQRLFLQSVYQALENAGYFSSVVRTGEAPKDVGVFVGSTMNDYEHHSTCHDPTAFTATSPKSYIPARVSHFFGWTGPTIVYDTTCSSSMVALHYACRSLLSGECSAAIAGGVNLITLPSTFRALAVANFSSPTGQCKPFSHDADGYCRAEGSGAVYLKRMSDAVRDGDRILGSIASTAIFQNQNITPFFVPNSASLAQLYDSVIGKANIDPSYISVMEAHGTGTQVGDAAEYASIKQCVVGSLRANNLFLGSAKGHVGHAEGTSGIISLIKILTMIQDEFIPPQASFTKISPHLNFKQADMIEIATSLQKWPEGPRTAFISNYGATGSNAAMVITSPQKKSTQPEQEHAVPFWVSGFDEQSVTAYCPRLAAYLQTNPSTTLSNLSYHLSLQSNRALPQRVLFTCQTRQELEEKLKEFSNGAVKAEITSVGKERPVILCFGGQTNSYIGLHRSVYDNIPLLRRHLDQCDAAIQAAGCSSILPEIFSNEPITDQAQLQAMLFAMQYSSARSWLDSGLSSRVAAVVGHSFGEFTALCISGALSLEETVKLVVARARLVRDVWGEDPGAMLMVNGDENLINLVLEEANESYQGSFPAGIACYNGPYHFTLAGSTEAIDAVGVVCESISGIKTKRLRVTNAFHSTLVQPLQEHVEGIAKGISLKQPAIRHERATESRSTASFNVWEHMRQPVYFHHAVNRLAEDFPSCVWLEAGSGSGVTSMASQALGTAASSHSFHSLNITDGQRGLDSLVATTMSLWKQDIPVTFWGHHTSQNAKFTPLSLPPYQFNNARHWLEHKEISTGPQQVKEAEIADLVSLVEGRGSGSGPCFAVDTTSKFYQDLINGHVLGKLAPVLPVSAQIGMVVVALYSIHPQWTKGRFQYSVHDMVSETYICVDPSRKFWLEFSVSDDQRLIWGWAITSTDKAEKAERKLVHVEGSLHIHPPDDDVYNTKFEALEKTISHRECVEILGAGLEDDENVHVVQGKTVYQVIDSLVSYGSIYRWTKRIVGRAGIAAGVVRKPISSTYDPGLGDAFCQVGAVAINCMTEAISPKNIWAHNKCGQQLVSPTYTRSSETWHVLVHHRAKTDRIHEMDIYVFDPTNGQLTQAIIGAQAVQVPRTFWDEVLSSLTTDKSALQGNGHDHGLFNPKGNDPRPATRKAERASSQNYEDVLAEVQSMVSKLLGVPVADVKPESQLADLGMDSLMGVEMGSDMEAAFKCSLDQGDMMDATSVEQLAGVIWDTIGGGDSAVEILTDSSLTDDEESSSSNSQSSADDVMPFNRGDIKKRRRLVRGFVDQYAANFTTPVLSAEAASGDASRKAVVVVTGGTGSLGSHVVARLAESPSVGTVVCLNRPGNADSALNRQQDAIFSKGIEMSNVALEKIHVLEATTSDSKLGLSEEDYTWLSNNGTDIMHCAFPLSPTQTVKGFEKQYAVMRNLIDLAREMAGNQPSQNDQRRRVGFQFVSSISVVGFAKQHPVPEELRGIECTQPMGYSEAKWVCEHILEATLRQHPDFFRAMTVRCGQIGGSSKTGFFNSNEHVPFMIKSAQNLRAWPDLDGHVLWVPVDHIASAMTELIHVEDAIDDKSIPNTIYHIEHPVGRTWKDYIPVMTKALDIPAGSVIPVQEWVNMVKTSKLDRSSNPASLFGDYYSGYYVPLMCGRALDSTQSRAHSKTMAELEPISDDTMKLYIDAWKECGTLRH
ncbi:unnamed protein product [Penicillium salamii]|uniref:Uncharacterized protein n=1 Tax=Penicillium salamii TaxID=1612424 RepID=A0A9W4IIH4_9EURO|nr:unnamed protein product [Penicillium salamii]CAG8287757.1 unnamed protein product [Penicillium salamii]CAG8420154.1 unnamed protein product [Penicillium salamii]CAG8420691.1 unnamed protein product [Penicillium salamii]